MVHCSFIICFVLNSNLTCKFCLQFLLAIFYLQILLVFQVFEKNLNFLAIFIFFFLKFYDFFIFFLFFIKFKPCFTFLMKFLRLVVCNTSFYLSSEKCTIAHYELVYNTNYRFPVKNTPLAKICQ